MYVVFGLSCPSHSATTLISTPDCNRCIAVACRMQCGEMWRPDKRVFVLEAAVTAKLTRWATLFRVIACPSRLGNKAESSPICGFNRNHARISCIIDFHNGTARCFRPLPCKWTPVSYTHLRAHETRHDLVCRLLLEKKKKK